MTKILKAMLVAPLILWIYTVIGIFTFMYVYYWSMKTVFREGMPALIEKLKILCDMMDKVTNAN